MSETAIDGGALVGKLVIGINTGRVIEPAATQFAQISLLNPKSAVGRAPLVISRALSADPLRVDVLPAYPSIDDRWLICCL
jgi:hypothetical protein